MAGTRSHFLIEATSGSPLSLCLAICSNVNAIAQYFHSEGGHLPQATIVHKYPEQLLVPRSDRLESTVGRQSPDTIVILVSQFFRLALERFIPISPVSTPALLLPIPQ